jgi:peptide methionine sulfoxide reductase MsrB
MAVIEVKRDPSKKPRKERKIRNATNAHLQHLFEEGGEDEGIDIT